MRARSKEGRCRAGVMSQRRHCGAQINTSVEEINGDTDNNCVTVYSRNLLYIQYRMLSFLKHKALTYVKQDQPHSEKVPGLTSLSSHSLTTCMSRSSGDSKKRVNGGPVMVVFPAFVCVCVLGTTPAEPCDTVKARSR